jgi:hypothetical protein
MWSVSPTSPAKAVKPMLDQLGIEFAELGLAEARFPHEERPARNVDRDPAQRLVHRRVSGAEARDAAPLAQCLGDGLAERQRRILGRVMLIDMQIAIHLQRDVDQRVSRQLLDHMIEEADPGRDIIDTRPIEVDGDIDRGFRGLAADGGCAHGRRYSVHASSGNA